ncbi:MAG TPA: hypothetical protein PK598_08155 [Thermoanaerobaculia bacterium]|nr:hypothetical protein [Thermoanaerobaculia bacterium]
MPRRAPILLLLALATAACGGREEAAAPTPRPPAVSPEPLRLRPGLALSLVPNLPGVPSDDVPEATRRDVEILAVDGKQMRLRWTGTVRMETAESARRREEWVRAASNAAAGATPLPAVPAAYEERGITGTLLFPDTAGAAAFLLPGLWPEGNATLPGASGLSLPRAAFADLKHRSWAKIPLLLTGQSLRQPAAHLLARASELAGETHADDRDLWRRTTSSQRFALRVDGRPVEVASFGAAGWFGSLEILDDGENPLVLAVLPSPARSPSLDLFAPAKVLKTLLGYRVAEVSSPPEAAR